MEEEYKTPTKAHLREVLVNALRRDTPSGVTATKKDSDHVLQMLIERGERSEAKNKIKKNTEKLSKTTKEFTVLKREDAIQEKPVKENKGEGSVNTSRKATVASVYLSDEEKTQYGNRVLPDYDKSELLGK